MQLCLNLVDLLSVPEHRRSLNEDFRRSDSDLRIIYLSPAQVESFDSFMTDLELEIDNDGLIGVRPTPDL